MSKIYDVIVLGAGPAGLAAGLYAGRSRLSVLIIEKGQDGGQIAITDEIENYPGQIVEGESGPSLIARMTAQAEKFGAERVADTITEVSLEGEVKVLKSAKAEYQGRNVIIATGAHARPIGCKGEAGYMGKVYPTVQRVTQTFLKILRYMLLEAETLLLKRQCILPSSQEKLRLFTDVMNFVLQNLFRRKHLRMKRSNLCGIL